MRSKMIPLLFLLPILTLTACESFDTFQTGVNDAAETVEQYAQENPALDEVTGNGLSATALLLYSIGSTLGLFAVGKKSRDRKNAIDEVISDPNNTASIESLKSAKVRRVVRESLRK